MNLIAAMGFFLVLRASMVKRKGEQTMGVGFDTCMKNSFWKGIYDNAPSDEVKEYYRIMFDTCSFAAEEEQDETAAEERLKELMLTREDAEYILRKAGTVQAKVWFGKVITELFDVCEADTVSASFFRGEILNPWYRQRQRR